MSRPPNPPTLGGMCSPRIGGRGAFPELLRRYDKSKKISGNSVNSWQIQGVLNGYYFHRFSFAVHLKAIAGSPAAQGSGNELIQTVGRTTMFAPLSFLGGYAAQERPEVQHIRLFSASMLQCSIVTVKFLYTKQEDEPQILRMAQNQE